MKGNLPRASYLQNDFPNVCSADLPPNWIATIERNFITQGFTFVQRTYYSQSFNKIRTDLHSFGTDRILITATPKTRAPSSSPGTRPSRTATARCIGQGQKAWGGNNGVLREGWRYEGGFARIDLMGSGGVVWLDRIGQGHLGSPKGPNQIAC